MSRPCTYSFFPFTAFSDDRISFHISQTLNFYLRSIPYFPSCVPLFPPVISSPSYFLCLPGSAHNPAVRSGCLCMSTFGACTTHVPLLDFRGRKQSYAEQHASFHFFRPVQPGQGLDIFVRWMKTASCPLTHCFLLECHHLPSILWFCHFLY